MTDVDGGDNYKNSARRKHPGEQQEGRSVSCLLLIVAGLDHVTMWL